MVMTHGAFIKEGNYLKIITESHVVRNGTEDTLAELVVILIHILMMKMFEGTGVENYKDQVIILSHNQIVILTERENQMRERKEKEAEEGESQQTSMTLMRTVRV